MASTVNVPLLGQQSKGTVVGVTIGGFAVAGYLIYRSQKKKAAAAAAATAQAQAQAANSYGYGQAAYGYGQPPGGYYGYGEPGIGASGGFYPGYYGYGLPEPQSIPNATNAQWAQAAISQLTSEGYDAQTVSAALGAYELGRPVTPAQQTIIQSAIGIEGYPPQPGANGFPPGIDVQGTNGGGSGGGQGGGGGGSGKVTVPNVVGDSANEGLGILRSAGFKAKTSPARNPRKEYTITAQLPHAGTQANRGSTVTVTVKADTPRKPNVPPSDVPPAVGGNYYLPQ